MPALVGDLGTLVSAIEDYKEALRAQHACSEAWNSGDPCEMASNDPSDQCIRDCDCEAKYNAVIIVARKHAPWVGPGSIRGPIGISPVLDEFSWCLLDYNNSMDNCASCESCGIPESDLPSYKASLARDMEYLVAAVEKIAGAHLI